MIIRWNYLLIINTRETRAFGGISLALRGTGASGVPSVPIWETTAFDGGKIKIKKTFGSPGAPHKGLRIQPPSAAFNQIKKLGHLQRPEFRTPSALLLQGACGPPNDFKYLTRAMRIPNMCLVLKLNNGKVVSITNEQSDRVTEPSSTVLVYRYNPTMIKFRGWAMGIGKTCCFTRVLT